MKKVTKWLFTLALLFAVTAFGQNASIENVLNTKGAKQNGPIIENEEIVGYYMFYSKEKLDRKTVSYEIKIFNEDYQEQQSIEIVRPKNTQLSEMVYNGKAFMLFFFDRKSGFEFATYDRHGEQIGSKKLSVKQINKMDFQASLLGMTNSTTNSTIFPLGEKGFVRASLAKFKKMGYELTAYDNELNVLWKQSSPEASKLLESININEVNDKFITATVYKRKSAGSRKMDTEYSIFDAKTGKVNITMAMGSADKGKESVLKSFYDESLNKIVMVGEFYKPGDDIVKDKSQGIYIQYVDKKGKISKRKTFQWDGDLDKFKHRGLSADASNAMKKDFYLFFHDVVRSADGHLYLIGEQFKKQVSAGGVALNVLSAASGSGGSGASAFEIRVMNMSVLEFDEKNDLVDYTIVEKKNTSVMLPAGMGLYGASYLGYIVHQYGGFDYEFTTKSKETNEFSVFYKDYDRKTEGRGKKADKMFGVIHFSENEMDAQRFPINSDSKSWWVQPAKPGYINVCEFDRKAKKLEVRREELTM